MTRSNLSVIQIMAQEHSSPWRWKPRKKKRKEFMKIQPMGEARGAKYLWMESRSRWLQSATLMILRFSKTWWKSMRLHQRPPRRKLCKRWIWQHLIAEFWSNYFEKVNTLKIVLIVSSKVLLVQAEKLTLLAGEQEAPVLVKDIHHYYRLKARQWKEQGWHLALSRRKREVSYQVQNQHPIDNNLMIRPNPAQCSTTRTIWIWKMKGQLVLLWLLSTLERNNWEDNYLQTHLQFIMACLNQMSKEFLIHKVSMVAQLILLDQPSMQCRQRRKAYQLWNQEKVFNLNQDHTELVWCKKIATKWYMKVSSKKLMSKRKDHNQGWKGREKPGKARRRTAWKLQEK